MYKPNDGRGDDNIAQNRFTAYLLAAIRNTKRTYMRKKMGILLYEQPFEIADFVDCFKYEPEMLSGLPAFEQLENELLLAAIRAISERDQYIFLSKALDGRSLREIGEELGLGFNTTSTIYHRLIRRMRREMQDERNSF